MLLNKFNLSCTNKIALTANVLKHGLFLLVMVLPGCAVGPDYKPLSPGELNIPQHWHAQLPHQGSTKELLDWWQQFKDPSLTFLVQAAVKHNPSLQDALAKIKQAGATTQISQARFYPTISIAPNMVTANSNAGSVDINGNPTPLFSTMTSGVSNTGYANINSSWEIDLFGANRRALEAAEAQLAASQQGWNLARVSLVSDVADNYTQYRFCQVMLGVYQKQLAANQATLTITNFKVKYGRSSGGDGQQASAAYFSTQAQIEQQQGVCGKLKNKLVNLTGVAYPAIESELQAHPNTIPAPPPLNVPAIPAQTLAQRPDVAIAEQQVVAANAEIGAAMAKRYPSLDIEGVISASTGIGGITPLSWSLGPTLNLTALDGGNLANQVTLNQGKYQAAVANYKTTVNNAVNEVEDALTRIVSTNMQTAKQQQASAAYQAYFEIMNKKYQIGSINILDLELARSNLLVAETTLYSAQLEQARAWIALYKASGGGWDQATPLQLNPDKAITNSESSGYGPK